MDQKGHQGERGEAEEGGHAEGQIEAVHHAVGTAAAGLELRVAGGRAEDGDEHGQPERRAHLLGDVDQAGRRPGVTGLDPGEARPW